MDGALIECVAAAVPILEELHLRMCNVGPGSCERLASGPLGLLRRLNLSWTSFKYEELGELLIALNQRSGKHGFDVGISLGAHQQVHVR